MESEVYGPCGGVAHSLLDLQPQPGIYNPNQASALTVTYSGANIVPGSFSVPPGEIARPAVEPFGATPGPSNIILTSGQDYSGILFEGDNVFYGLVQVDADGAGVIHDWGFPFIPIEQLTARVLVAAGNGCTELDCAGTSSSPGTDSRSLIWVTAEKDCECKIDADGDGVFERNFVLAALGCPAH